MTLYFLNSYIERNRIPKQLIDTNIISDYRKIEVYAEYYLTYLSKKAEIEKNSIDTEIMNYEILENGEVNTIIETLGQYLTNLSNRDYTNFSEKYVKIIFYSIKKLKDLLISSDVKIDK